MIAQIHETDREGRLTLPSQFASSRLLVQVVSDEEIIVRRVPATEDVGDAEELPPFSTLKPLSDRDRDLFLSLLDSPPKPNEQLRALMSKSYPEPSE
jgi:hypothetical protein